MFFYLLKNSTIVDNNYDTHNKNIKILIYGSICYIILHASLFLGGKDAVLYSLKPYFWLFLLLDLIVFYINDADNIKEIITNNKNGSTNSFKNINDIFDSFLKNKNINGNDRFNKRNNTQPTKPTLKKNIRKQVRFVDEDHYSSSSDSDIGTDIDIESFKESLNNI